MIVHRILDVVFRTLDAVDVVRAKVDQALGKEPRPQSSWPALVDPSPARPVNLESAKIAYADSSSATSPITVPAAAPKAAVPKAAVPKAAAAKKATQKAKSTSAPASEKAETTAAKVGPKTKTKVGTKAHKQANDTRKGSVDRKGVDFDSPRARAIQTFLSDNGGAVVADDAALDGKKTLARVLWAVAAAEAAGSAAGLTAADASALLSAVAGLEVFSTNVGRAFRDETDLFEETVPDGRSKRYKLTNAGRERLAEVATR